MNIYPHDSRWNALQSHLSRQLPDATWTLRQLETTSVSGQVMVIVERVSPGRTGDQVLGVGKTEEAAIQDAIRIARMYPAPSA